MMRTDAAIPWNAYPSLLLALCLTAGLWTAAHFPGVPYAAWMCLAGAGLALAIGARWHARHRLVTPLPLLNLIAAALVVGALGGARYVVYETTPPHHIRHLLPALSDQSVTLEGIVAGEPDVRPSGTRFTLASQQLFAGADTLPAVGAARITLARSRWQPMQTFPSVRQGDRVRVHGRLRPPPGRRNPAEFDYGRYLRRRGVHATLHVYASAGVVVDRAVAGRPHLLSAARSYVRAQIERHVPSPTGRMVLVALLLGDRSQFDEGTREHFARTGLMHLLAVSGLHVLLVGMVLYELLRPLLVRLRFDWRWAEIIRAGITMGLLVLYTLLAGASASAVRATIMTGLFIGGNVFQRASNPLNALGAAAFVLLLARPTFLFDVGFQLSFSAVVAIVMLNPVFTRWFPETYLQQPAARWLVGTLATSLAATLGTLPALLYHFGSASFAGLVLNLLAIPITLLTLSAGLLTVLAGGGPAPLGESLGAAADVLGQGLVATASTGHAWLGWAAVNVTMESPWFLLALVASLMTLAQWHRRRHRWRLCVLAAALLTVGVWSAVLGGGERPALEVLFFDVGQGDAALVTLPNGKHLLIDAGARDAYTDQGRRTLLPHLHRYGIRRLDAVVITHPHSDHLGGLPALLRAVPVNRVFHNGQVYPSDLYAETMSLLDSLHVPHGALYAGDTLSLDPTVRVQVLGPSRERAQAGAEANDASVMLRVAYGETVLLFAGDAEASAEAEALAHFAPLLASTVVKVGHHGSSTSSIPAFVASAVPEGSRGALAVVSVGRNNRYGLPSSHVLARWRSRGASVLLTEQEGAVWLRSDGSIVHRHAWR